MLPARMHTCSSDLFQTFISEVTSSQGERKTKRQQTWRTEEGQQQCVACLTGVLAPTLEQLKI